MNFKNVVIILFISLSFFIYSEDPIVTSHVPEWYINPPSLSDNRKIAMGDSQLGEVTAIFNALQEISHTITTLTEAYEYEFNDTASSTSSKIKIGSIKMYSLTRNEISEKSDGTIVDFSSSTIEILGDNFSYRYRLQIEFALDGTDTFTRSYSLNDKVYFDLEELKEEIRRLKIKEFLIKEFQRNDIQIYEKEKIGDRYYTALSFPKDLKFESITEKDKEAFLVQISKNLINFNIENSESERKSQRNKFEEILFMFSILLPVLLLVSIIKKDGRKKWLKFFRTLKKSSKNNIENHKKSNKTVKAKFDKKVVKDKNKTVKAKFDKKVVKDKNKTVKKLSDLSENDLNQIEAILKQEDILDNKGNFKSTDQNFLFWVEMSCIEFSTYEVSYTLSDAMSDTNFQDVIDNLKTYYTPQSKNSLFGYKDSDKEKFNEFLENSNEYWNENSSESTSYAKNQKYYQLIFDLEKGNIKNKAIIKLFIKLVKKLYINTNKVRYGIPYDRSEMKWCGINKTLMSNKYFIPTKKYISRKESLKKTIHKLLEEKAVKMPASDIDAHLKHKDLDEIKELCEDMYINGDISRTGNYRYFILTEKKEKPKKSSATKSGKVDVKSELKKFKEMLDDGLIKQEDYDAKKKELLGL